MMDLLLATSGGEAQAASGGYVDDVFSAYTYTGNGSTQTINNGIDLAGKGGLVWTKVRNVNSSGIITGSHTLFDSARSLNRSLQTNTTGAQTGVDVFGALTASSTGYSISVPSALLNGNTADFVSWTFRKAPKFFDVVTYTGDGTNNRQIAHGLGCEVGFAVVKRTNIAANWLVQHRSIDLTGNKTLYLSLTSAIGVGNNNWNSTHATSTHLILGDHEDVNTAGNAYVAYLFAHDPSTEGIIQCGSFTDDSPQVEINLGWEPQYILTKCTSHVSNWMIKDASRGMHTTALDGPLLYANASNAEVSDGPAWPTATGFKHFNGTVGRTYIYLAIRRSNKPPTSGTQVYNAIARTGTGAAATVTGAGFAPDLLINAERSHANDGNTYVRDRLRGIPANLMSHLANAETSGTSDLVSWGMDGVSVDGAVNGSTNQSGLTYINWFFRRAKGFFDVVCYTGTGVARTVSHNLGVAPELMIVKNRTSTTDWKVYLASVGATKAMSLNYTSIPSQNSWWSDSTPTSSGFSVGVHPTVNDSGFTYVAYLFATLPGISKVGSYTGNGSSQTINCGFATGARFILIKRTDATGDWYVWDSVRGIIAANDPHLSLNTTAAEVTTDDSVDPEASGFIVNQNTATNINVNGGQYIFLAIA